MRFSSRQGTSEQELNATTADVVLQLGEAKIPIKAEKLLGATVRVSRSNQNLAGEQRQPRSPYERAQNDEDKAIEALSRMQEELSWTHTGAGAGGGKWPWSPDDLYPSDSKLYQPTQHGNHHTPNRLRREPSDANLPAYYDPTEQPYYVSQQTSASAVRDMALHKGAPTIFDNIGETPQRRLSLTAMKQHEVSRRSKTTGHGPRPRKLDLVQLFPQPRPSTGRLLSPSRLQHSPSAMTDRADYPLPPLPHESHTLNSKKSGTLDTSSVRPSTAASGVAGKHRTFDEDIFDQHKTNVRRPPKGIQNWFDAFLDTDEDDDDDEGPIDQGPEPQELPADEIQPPAYHPPSREVSRASHKSVQPPVQQPQAVPQQMRSLDPIRDERQAVERLQEHEDLSRRCSTSECYSWDSTQSSHLGQPLPAAVESQLEVESNSRAGQSVLSLSDSDYDDLEDNSSGSQVKDRPAIRDSIMDYRHVTVGAASRVGMQKLQQKSQKLQAIRSLSHESKEMETKRSSSRTSVSNTTPYQAEKQMPMALHEEMHPTAEQVALRRLNGLSLESSATSNSTGEQALRSTPSTDLPSDAAHMMAVTEEEMMLLDLMRRKRAMMQQMSFTEGYQLALQTEQQRLARRTESAQKNAMKALQRKESERRDSQISSSRASPPVTQSDSDIRRHLSAIRKEQVDERFQIERFLGMSQPQPLSSHPPDLAMPTELPKPKESSSTKSREPSGELLPATVYSPAATPTGRSPATQGGSLQSPHDNDSDSVKRRVDHFIATNGAVPPLNTTLKTMRKKSSRTPASMPPSPVIEEDHHAPPAVPVRSPARAKDHQRDASDQSWQLRHKVSSVSMDTDTEPRDKSPVHTFLSRNHSTHEGERTRSPDEDHYTPLLPSKPGVECTDPNSLQRTQTLVSAMTNSPSMSTMSPISPFSSIISAASATPKPLTPQSRQTSAYTEDTEYSRYSRSTPPGGSTAQVAHVVNLSGAPSARGLNVERKRPLPPPLSQLNTIDAAMDGHAINKHSSLMSITSAGEDVLAAWKDLGGGSDCLRTKKRVATRPSGGVGEVVN